MGILSIFFYALFYSFSFFSFLSFILFLSFLFLSFLFLKIICRDEILFANQNTSRVKIFQSPDDPMNYRVITAAPPGDDTLLVKCQEPTF
jgi:hypothetical protein